MATTKTKEVLKTKMKTGKVRASYANVWVAQAMKNEDGTTGQAKYSCVLLIPKKDKKTLALMEECIEEAKIIGKAKKWNGVIPSKLKLPIRDGDEEKEKPEEYRGHWFITGTSNQKPGIIGLDGEPITERDEFYSGVYCKAAINFYPFAVKGNKGIAVGLNNLLKVEDGERLAGGSSAADDFAEDIEGDDDL